MPIPTTSGHTDSCPGFAGVLRSWYQDPMWQNLNLFPWMDDEWALRLSEVYTRLEMETFTGKLHERRPKLLGDYRELFTDVQPEGTRILVKGDPGIGKTTFTHKVAYDWATGNLPQFDVVLVLKLKFSNKHQTIESMVVNQLEIISENPSFMPSEVEVCNYLKSGKDKVLLVLDGLDEIKLKEFPHVQRVLRGEAYRRCCILATTRPHVAASYQNKATSVAKILGFSEEKAVEFTSYIISDQSERENFFKQIHERNMSEMARVPILVQALALLFRENKQLPDTLKTTYDDLVFYLRKTCEDSKGLTEDEIKAAIDDINELAFRGLICADRQLVFRRDEIQNENILKLGLLAAEKSGSGFKPTTVLYFLHKTLQEYCTSDHVTKEIKNGNRRPWEALVRELRSCHPWEPLVEYANRNDTTYGFFKRTNETSSSCDGNLVASTASKETKKTKPKIGKKHKDRVSIIDSLLKTIEPRCALNTSDLCEVGSFLLKKIDPRFTKNNCRHMKTSLPRKVKSLQMKIDSWLRLGRFPLDLFFTSALWYLLEKLCEPLFIFLIGKLPLNKLELIIAEITELIFTLSVDETSTSGSMLYLHNIREGIEKLIKEIRPQTESTEIDEILMQNPALIDLTAPFESSYSRLESVARQPRLAALRVTGTGGQDDSNFLRNVNHILKRLSNIHTVELDDLSHVADADVRAEFIDALCRSSIVCLELFNLDPFVTKVLLEKLPESVRFVSVCQGCDTVQTEPYKLLRAENLVTLSLECCVVDLSQASFPNLRQLFIDGISVASENGAIALVDATSSMWNLEYFGMYRCRSVFLGPLVVELLQQSKLRHAMLVDCNLSAGDGELILESIEDGKLDHIESLRLFGHNELREQEQRFMELCHGRIIEHQISHEPLFDISTLFQSESQSGSDEDREDYDYDAASLVNLLTGIIRKQVEEFREVQYLTSLKLFIKNTAETKKAIMDDTEEEMGCSSSMIQEQTRTGMTGYSSGIPELMQSMITTMGHITPEQAQFMMTNFFYLIQELLQSQDETRTDINMKQELVQTVLPSLANVSPELCKTVMTTVFNMTPKDVQTLCTVFFNMMTPDLAQTMMTSVSNATDEQIQSMVFYISDILPELMQTEMTRLSNMTPEQLQTYMSPVFNKTPEEMQNSMALFLNMTPEQMRTTVTRCSETPSGQAQMIPCLPSSYPDQSSSRSHQGTATSEALEQHHASGATGINNSVSQEQEGNDMAQTMTREVLEPQNALIATGADNAVTQEQERNHAKDIMAAFVSDFFENKSIFTGQPETLSKEAPQLLFDFSSIQVPANCNTNNSADQHEAQEPKEDSRQSDGQSDGERKYNDYVDDLDLD